VNRLRPRTRAAHAVLPGGLAATAVRLPTVPLAEVRLRLPVPVTGPRQAAAAEALAETLLGPASATTQRLARQGCYAVAAADQDHLCVAATLPAAALPTLLAETAAALTGPPPRPDRVAAVITALAAGARAGAEDPEAVCTGAALRLAYGERSPYAHEWCAPGLLADLEPEDVTAALARVSLGGGSAVIVGDIDPDEALALLACSFGGLGHPAGAPRGLPPLPPRPRNLALHRPGAAQSTVRRVAVLPPEARTAPGWRVADLAFGGRPASRLARALREDRGYAYIARSRLVRRPRAADLRVIADVSAAATADSLAVLEETTRALAHGLGGEERAAAGRFAANSLLMSRGGQCDLAAVLTEELCLGRSWEDIERDPRRLREVTPGEAGEATAVLATARWHCALLTDLDRVDPASLPPLAGEGWTVAC
jgi:zinc protease